MREILTAPCGCLTDSTGAALTLCDRHADERTHFPLSRAALCLDCEHVFALRNQCPACGGQSFLLLANALRPRAE